MVPDEAPEVPPHVEETVAAIARVHAAHYREAAALQRLAAATRAAIARPRTLGLLVLAVVGWIVLNAALPAYGRMPPDPFPFPALATAVSTGALFLTTMVLIAQRHDDELAAQREQLTLELAILAEQKSAKIIALLEEFRRNDPHQSNRRDKEAEALAQPADPQVVLDVIKAAHEAPAVERSSDEGPLT